MLCRRTLFLKMKVIHNWYLNKQEEVCNCYCIPISDCNFHLYKKIFISFNICHSKDNIAHETCSDSKISSWYTRSSEWNPINCPKSTGNIQLRHSEKSPAEVANQYLENILLTLPQICCTAFLSLKNLFLKSHLIMTWPHRRLKAK